jgi:hypothetical protein
MTYHNRSNNTELLKRLVKQVGLLICCPDAIVRTFTMTKPGTVKDYDPVAVQQNRRDAARVVVVPCDHVAVNENDRTAFATVAVV